MRCSCIGPIHSTIGMHDRCDKKNMSFCEVASDVSRVRRIRGRERELIIQCIWLVSGVTSESLKVTCTEELTSSRQFLNGRCSSFEPFPIDNSPARHVYRPKDARERERGIPCVRWMRVYVSGIPPRRRASCIHSRTRGRERDRGGLKKDRAVHKARCHSREKLDEQCDSVRRACRLTNTELLHFSRFPTAPPVRLENSLDDLSTLYLFLFTAVSRERRFKVRITESDG